MFQKLNKRQEMAKAIWMIRRELQQQEVYTRKVGQELSSYISREAPQRGNDLSGVMKAVKDAMEDQIKKYPGVFGKGAQK